MHTLGRITLGCSGNSRIPSEQTTQVLLTHTQRPAGGFSGLPDRLLARLRSAERLTDGLRLHHTEVCDGSSSPSGNAPNAKLPDQSFKDVNLT